MVINGLLLVYAAVQTSRINDCLQFIAMNRTVPWWQGCPLSSATYAICVQPSFSERLVFMRGWAIALLAQNVLNYILAIVDMAAPGTVAAVVIAGILSFAGVVIFLIMFFSNKDAKKVRV